MPPEPFALASSWLTDGSYDPDTRALTIVSRDGKEYVHQGVPPDVAAGLITSPSPGRFWHSQIKGRY